MSKVSRRTAIAHLIGVKKHAIQSNKLLNKCCLQNLRNKACRAESMSSGTSTDPEKPAQPKPRSNPFGLARPREEVLKGKASTEMPATDGPSTTTSAADNTSKAATATDVVAPEASTLEQSVEVKLDGDADTKASTQAVPSQEPEADTEKESQHRQVPGAKQGRSLQEILLRCFSYAIAGAFCKVDRAACSTSLCSGVTLLLPQKHCRATPMGRTLRKGSKLHHCWG